VKRSKKKKRRYWDDHPQGYSNLERCIAEHAPPGMKCLINSEWGEEDTARMAYSCGYDDFQVVPGHYDLVDGDAIFDPGTGCMLFVTKGTLTEDMLCYS
jgi:hypothetical protein